jgi:cyclase
LKIVILLAALFAAFTRAQNADLAVLPVQGSVYMLVGPNGNAAVQIGKDGVLVVDTMSEPLAPRILAEVKRLAAGASPVATGGATIIAHENVVNRMTAPVSAGQAASASGVPNDEYSTRTKDLYLNGEPIIIFHEAKAHTDGDSIVLFRRSDVISAGDIFTPDRYPEIDVERGGSVQGLITALNHLLHLTVPEHLQDGGTRVIPGHGRLCNEADVVEYRDMVAIVRDRVRALLQEGKTLDQVRAARPTLDYDTQYGSGDRFIEAVYRSLKEAK